MSEQTRSGSEARSVQSDNEAWARGEWVDGSRLGTDLKPNSKFQPRYVAYCRANGKTPDEMMAHDVVAYPGGKMCGFVLWIGAQWGAWRKANGRRHDDFVSDADHKSFDVFVGAA